jgi:hypothetical protein
VQQLAPDEGLEPVARIRDRPTDRPVGRLERRRPNTHAYGAT